MADKRDRLERRVLSTSDVETSDEFVSIARLNDNAEPGRGREVQHLEVVPRPQHRLAQDVVEGRGSDGLLRRDPLLRRRPELRLALDELLGLGLEFVLVDRLDVVALRLERRLDRGLGEGDGLAVDGGEGGTGGADGADAELVGRGVLVQRGLEFGDLALGEVALRVVAPLRLHLGGEVVAEVLVEKLVEGAGLVGREHMALSVRRRDVEGDALDDDLFHWNGSPLLMRGIARDHGIDIDPSPGGCQWRFAF